MGAYICKRPETYSDDAPISYELLCNSLTKWFGEESFFAHVFHLDDFSTSFISEVIRWRVCGKRQEKYEYVELVLKMYPRNEETRSFSFRSDVFFKNEITFYEKILPELLKFHNGKSTIPFSNHLKLFVSVCDSKDACIVFENEFEQGFENSRDKLDVKHVQLILRTLAKFHAISFAMKDQNREEYERLCCGIDETYYKNTYWGWYRQFWTQICAVAIDAVEKEYPKTKYTDLVKKFAVRNRFRDLITAVNDCTSKVILHGDCAVSNYMFKYVDGSPVDVKMLDFQQCRCASPALDVCSILYNNADLLNDEESLLKYYYEALASQIKELGSNPEVYTWDDFVCDVQRYSYFGLSVSFENVHTTLTSNDIMNRRVALKWLRNGKVKNIAEVYEVKYLEGKQRRDLAKNFVHCVDRGYITGTLLETPLFNFW